MSNNTENTNEWVRWIEEAVDKEYYRFYEHEHFSNIKIIGNGGFGKVFRADWRNSEQCFALKSFFNLNNDTAKEIVHEVLLNYEIKNSVTLQYVQCPVTL